MRKAVYLLTVLIFLGLAVYMYSPLPEDMDQPWAQLLWVIPGRSVIEICKYTALLGVTDFFNCSRKFSSLVEYNPSDLSDKDLKVVDTYFDGVPVRLFQPRDISADGHPGVIYIHGGGWGLLNVKIYDGKTREIAKALNAVVASIDYRLAPENPFPIPFEDCLRATKHFLREAESFNVDTTRIAIEGDSAGGNLAMAVAMALADTNQEEKLPSLRMLVMLYPVLQIVDFNMTSHIQLTSGPYALTRRMLIYMSLNYAFGNIKLFDTFLANNQTCHTQVKHSLKQYLYRSPMDQLPTSSCPFGISDDVAEIITNKSISPLLATDEDLSRLPPTYVMTAQYDPLTDEGFLLVDRMRKLNLTITHAYWKGVQHGFLFNYSIIDKTKLAFDELLDFMRRAI